TSRRTSASDSLRQVHERVEPGRTTVGAAAAVHPALGTSRAERMCLVLERLWRRIRIGRRHAQRTAATALCLDLSVDDDDPRQFVRIVRVAAEPAAGLLVVLPAHQ